MGLRDTYISLILPQVGFGIPISMFLYIGFMDYIPNELQESAYLDGAEPVAGILADYDADVHECNHYGTNLPTLSQFGMSIPSQIHLSVMR